MGSNEYGPWEPLPLREAITLFGTTSFRWWVSGGHALELHLDRSWRTHDDTDVSILRCDAGLLLDALPGWDLHVAAAGELTPWDGLPLSANRSENNLWCRPTPDALWSLDITISDGDEHDWVYRRDPSIRRNWPDAVLTTRESAPYLAPELQLLFKSKDVRPKDEVDVRVVLPTLTPQRKALLHSFLPDAHPWQELFDPRSS